MSEEEEDREGVERISETILWTVAVWKGRGSVKGNESEKGNKRTFGKGEVVGPSKFAVRHRQNNQRSSEAD